jgi:hypothetical protein
MILILPFSMIIGKITLVTFGLISAAILKEGTVLFLLKKSEVLSNVINSNLQLKKLSMLTTTLDLQVRKMIEETSV